MRGFKINRESKKEREEREKLEKLMTDFYNKYGLTNLDEIDVKILEQIMLDLAGTGGFLGQLSTLGFRAAEMQMVNAL